VTYAEPTSRRMWRLFETVHDVVYFSDEIRRKGDELGYKGFWMAYFAFRLAPLGEVTPDVGIATCYNFSPRRVARALPDAWTYAGAERALAGRLAAAGDALRRLAGGGDWRPVGDLLWRAAEAADLPGRPLAAANSQLPRPTDELEAIWLATTILREHRGDGHNAVLLSRSIGPVVAHLLKSSSGESDGEVLRTGRAFTEDEWAAGVADARSRGWLDADDRLTAAGRAEHDAVEQATDELAAGPWQSLGAATEEAYERLLPLARAVHGSGMIPAPSPVGLAWDDGA
jgi:hypothetical protein